MYGQGQGKTRYEGGYYFIQRNDLIRSGIHAHTAAVDRPISDETLRALNAVQSTPWRINGWILDTLRAAFTSGARLGDIPYADLIHVPRKSDEEWEAMDEDEKADWKKMLSEIHGDNARMEGRRHSFLHKLDIAQEMRDRPIWFPHFLDFRGRFYPMCQDLHPQGDDIARSLLMFHEGKRLGATGLYWLAVRLANCYGQDKLPFEDRVGWVVEHEHLIMDSAIDPLDGSRFWADTDEDPWCFLATCREWYEAHLLDNPQDYVSHLPVQLDGSCNGLQHLSAMGRDPVGAWATNVAANYTRHDVYVEVADVVKEAVSNDAISGDPSTVAVAHEWVGRIDRKVVKRAVMTTPYGVTPRGISEQLIADGHTKGMSSSGLAAAYLRDKIVDGLDQTVVVAKQIMAWIQAIATALSRHGIPFRFTTPTGNVIQQSYYKLNQTRVSTLLGMLTIWEEDPVGGLNDRKQMLASAPNFIHAFDAAHLARTVNRMVDERGPTSFSMIHDSFGTHAADIPYLSQYLREEFVRIYSENWLEKLEAEVRSYAPDVKLPSYTEFVTLGDFDVSEVLRSQFFFA